MTQRTVVRRNERNIPLSEGFEICFCLIVSEREIRGRGEREGTDRGSEKWAQIDGRGGVSLSALP